jgi:hypothetical protein
MKALYLFAAFVLASPLGLMLALASRPAARSTRTRPAAGDRRRSPMQQIASA